MYTLEQVIEEFKRHIKLFTKDSIQRNYYEIIVKYLLLESKHPQEVKDAKKVIYHYFQYDLPRYVDVTLFREIKQLPEVEEMTLEQVCKELGREVKIVK